MNFGTIRDSHLTVDLAGSVGPVGSGLLVLGVLAAGLVGVVALALLVRAVVASRSR
jgi:hypothetical protein